MTQSCRHIIAVFPNPLSWELQWPNLGKSQQRTEKKLVHVAVRGGERTPNPLSQKPKSLNVHPVWSS